MPDKSQNSHIERTVYVACEVQPGGSIRYGNWEDSEERAKRCGECLGRGTVHDRSWRDVRCEFCRGTGRVRPLPLTLIDYASGSDYSGSLVEHSNYRTLKAEFPWLVEIHGSHGTFALGYLGKRKNQNPALIEAIDSLCSYCVYSDDDHSELELEKTAEAWADDGRKDFKRELEKYFNALYAPDEHDLDLASDERIDALWYAATERLCGGEDHLNEQGDQIYFPISRVIEKFRRSWPGMSRNGYDGSPSLDEMLVRLAEDCTINTANTESDNV
jgi:hypothetical protein